MGVTGFVIIVVLLIIILMQIKDIKKLIIPVRKGIIEISSLVVILLTFGGIIIFFGRKWSHYLMCLLAISMFTLMWLKIGITSNGFSSMYRGKEKIRWNEIEKVVIKKELKKIKVEVYGRFMTENFYFRKENYERIIDVLKSNLPSKSQLICN